MYESFRFGVSCHMTFQSRLNGINLKFTIYLAHINAPFSHHNAFTTRNDGKNIATFIQT